MIRTIANINQAAPQRMKTAEKIRQRIKSAPATTGVYRWLAGDQVIYVGKSVNLRQRLSSYLHLSVEKNDPRLVKMVAVADIVDWTETTDELNAMLLEDQLIKEHNPDYNKRQRDWREYRFLRFTDDSLPALKMTADPPPGDFFGPFRDRFFVVDLRRILSRYRQFPSCNDPAGNTICPDYDLGLCTAPCAGKISPVDYQKKCHQVSEFLKGGDLGIARDISSLMETESAVGNFEQAAICRDDLNLVQRFSRRQNFFEQFRTRSLVITGSDSSDEKWEFVRGKPADHALENDDIRFIFDRANLIYTWLNKQGDKYRYEFTKVPGTFLPT